MSEVTDIGSAIRVSHPAAEVLAQSFGLELWLRTYVVSRIPGAEGGGEDDQADADPASSARRSESPGRTGRSDLAASCVSDVLGSEVRGPDGVRIGVLNELFCVGPTGDSPRSHLRVTHVEYSDHLSGSELGYNDDCREGPAAVGIVIRRWQRGSRVSPLDDVNAVDLEAGAITVARHHEHVHPHQL